MKKIIFFIFFTSLTIISCKNQFNIEENTGLDKTSIQRKLELAEYAAVGNYILTQDEVTENLKSFLSKKEFTNCRATNKTNKYTVSIIDTETISLGNDDLSNNRSASLDEYNDVNFYLYEIKNNETSEASYAVLSDDRRIGEIITISDNSEFTEDISDSPFMQLFCTKLETYLIETGEIWNSLTDEDIQNARSAYSNIATSGNYIYSDWKYNSGNISNLLTTKWKQTTPYNSGIEAVKGKKYITGCGATAVAQVMAFHEYPKSCSSKIMSQLKNNWIPASSWNGNYNWSLMKGNPRAEYLSSEGKMMVGAFMYQVAEGVKSNYGTSATSTYNSNYPLFLKSVGYNTDSVTAYSYEKIKSSINNGCPLVITGSCIKNTKKHKFLWWSWETVTSYEGGHAWVVDGYCNMKCTATNKSNKSDVQTFVTNYVHCNLGWSGSSNGYYIDKVFSVNKNCLVNDWEFNNINRSSYGEDYYYQYKLEIIPNIKPNR